MYRTKIRSYQGHRPTHACRRRTKHMVSIIIPTTASQPRPSCSTAPRSIRTLGWALLPTLAMQANRISQFTDTQVLKSKSFSAYSDASSIRHFPQRQFGLQALTPLVQPLQPPKTKFRRRRLARPCGRSCTTQTRRATAQSQPPARGAGGRWARHNPAEEERGRGGPGVYAEADAGR